MTTTAICETNLPNRKPVARGKVRDIYDLGNSLIIVATDRLSAFDWVNPVGIPDKGKLLTQMTLFWLEHTKDVVDNHLLSADVTDFPKDFQDAPDQFAGRSMLVKKCQMLPIECVVRGYLAGSGWKEYRNSGSVCGIPLPPGLVEASRLEEPIFTPATKATDGHDLNITATQAAELVGAELAEKVSAASKAIYLRARELAEAKGIIVCDTKLEFGLRDGQLLLADEILTPDSSRFWPAAQYRPGINPPSYDKQFVRDWLETTGWDKNSPPPPLPDEVVVKTREKYLEAFTRLTGRTESQL